MVETEPGAVERRCPVCWRPFTATNPSARYCSGACRVEDWRRRRDTAIPHPPTTVDTPSRDDNETTSTPTGACPVCRTEFTRVRRQLYRSAVCRKTAWRRRAAAHPPTTPVPPPGRRRQHTVYACPDCDTRYLAEQRCPDCNIFCRRIGAGGPCPHCDEPVAVTDLTNPDQPKETPTMATP